jgi:hypothetical protein
MIMPVSMNRGAASMAVNVEVPHRECCGSACLDSLTEIIDVVVFVSVLAVSMHVTMAVIEPMTVRVVMSMSVAM